MDVGRRSEAGLGAVEPSERRSARPARRFPKTLYFAVPIMLLVAIGWADAPPAFLLKWGVRGSSDGQFEVPVSIAADAHGRIYVGDGSNHRVQKFDPDSAFILKWGTSGTGDGQFNTVGGIAAGPDGAIYVADQFNHRIQKFDSTGTYLGQWGSYGTADGQFNQPLGLAVDASNNVYVADFSNQRIQKFDSNGNFLLKWGSLGSGEGEFNGPAFLAVNAAGEVFVTDQLNSRVQKFQSNGVFITRWGSFGSGDGQFVQPSGIAVDALGNVFVADQGNHHVEKFDGNGTFLARWGLYGIADGQFAFPAGLAVDGQANLYVVDKINRRVQKFGLNTIAAGPAGGCISVARPCITVPVVFTRGELTPVRAYSVTFELSPNLQLCGPIATHITPNGYLPNSQFYVIDHGGGRYTVDEATLGMPCTALGNATLFNIKVTSPDLMGSGNIRVTEIKVRDCDNVPLPAYIGADASITIDQVAPPPMSVTALTRATSNPTSDGVADILLSWTGQEPGAAIAIYRKAFGGYPQYDENGGAVPAVPSTPEQAGLQGWTLMSFTHSPVVDHPPTRDYYYYVGFQADGAGNLSPGSNVASALNYHLGDVHNAVTDCAGNSLVNTSDISFLGNNYGITVPVNGALECLDVGPTSDLTEKGRPVTDNVLDFEDLMMFSLNYGSVSAPQARALPSPAAANGLRLSVPALPAVGETFSVALEMDAAGDIQGLSVDLGYNAAAVEPLRVEAGDLLGRQALPGLALSSRPGNVDVALLGHGYGLRGTGELARVIFRVKRAGEARIGLARAMARDGANRPVALGERATTPSASPPPRTALGVIYPNPFQQGTTIQLSLSRAERVRLAVYDVTGRRVRSLVDGPTPAGEMRVTWDGRSNEGTRVPSGFYVLRLEAGEVVQTRQVHVLR